MKRLSILVVGVVLNLGHWMAIGFSGFYCLAAGLFVCYKQLTDKTMDTIEASRVGRWILYTIHYFSMTYA